MQSVAVRKAVLNPFIRAASCSLTRLQSAAIISCRQSHVRTIHTQIPTTTLLVDSDRLRNYGLSQYSRFVYQTRSYAADMIVKVPPMAESISEGQLREWMKKVGDFVKQDEEVTSIETDKIDIPVNCPASGTITEVYANESDTVIVGQDLFKLHVDDGSEGAASKGSEEKSTSIGNESQPSKEPTKEKPQPEPVKKDLQPEEPSKAEPKKDATKAGMAPPPPKPSSLKPESTQSSKPTSINERPIGTGSPFGTREERHVPMSRMRQRIAERLKESQNTAASLTTFNEVDMSNLMELRNAYKDKFFEKHGVKLGFMSAFVKASAAALHELPAVNASIVGNEIVYHDYIDTSVAVATPKGLLTPVLRNVETMSFMQIEKEITELGKKARDGKITIEDMAGGTFTISNGGVFGSLMGTPIINMPQTAILGMHAVKERPMVVNGKIEIRPMMYIALTYDHRLVDGREGVLFLVKLKEAIEDPRRLLLEV